MQTISLLGTIRARVAAGAVVLTTAALLLMGVQLHEQAATLDTGLARAGEAEADVLRLELALEAGRALEAAAAAAADPAVQAATAARDRDALRRVLAPAFEALRQARPSTEQFQVFVNERPSQGASGQGPWTTALLRMQAPARFGDDVSGWRVIMNRMLAAPCGSQGLIGLEMSTSGVAMHGAVPVCHAGRNVGTLNVGLRFDRAFLEGIAARRPGSYALYLPAELQAEGRPSFAPLLRQGQLAFDPGRHVLHPVGALHEAPVLSSAELAAAFAGATVTRLAWREGHPVMAVAFPVFNVAGERIGVMEALRDGSAAAAASRRAAWTAAFGFALLAAIALAVVLVLDRLVGQPLRRLSTAIGGLTTTPETPLPEQERGGEVGSIARALEALRHQLLRGRAAETEAAAERERAESARQAATRDAAAALEDTFAAQRAGLDAAAKRLGEVAARLAAAVTHGEAQSSTLSAAAQQTRQSVSGIAAAVEQMSASVSDIAHRAREAAAAAGRAAERTAATGTTVDGLATAAQRIQEVMSLIGGIASQTSLLALNATIEAARAGEAGKGFAVVASEVKALAAQTARATDDIASQIDAIRKVTADAVQAMREIAVVVEEVDGIAAAIAGAVEQQSGATREIADRAQLAARGTEDLAKGLDVLSAAVSGTRDAVEETSRAAEGLRAQGGQIGEAVDALAAKLRAA